MSITDRIVAHDLKNPLTTALSVSELLNREKITEDQREYISYIKKSLYKMNSMITQIIDNLLSNAIKFSNHNTKVHVTLKDENQTIRFEIADEGPGILEEDQPKLFQKFQKLHAQPTDGESSTGLGLSIVKKYADAMKGKVWCESEFGKGAKFIVEFKKS
jgi:signal transduction histidine kinase